MLNIAKIESQESEKAPTLHWRHWRIRSRAGIMPRCCIWNPAYRTPPSSLSRVLQTLLSLPVPVQVVGAVGQDRLGTSPCLQQHHIAVLLCCHA